jgi:hypothetical protein
MSDGISWYYNHTKGDRIAERFMSSIVKLIRNKPNKKPNTPFVMTFVSNPRIDLDDIKD